MASSDEPPVLVFPSKEWDIEHIGLHTTPLIRAAADKFSARFNRDFCLIFVGEQITNDFITGIIDEVTFTPHGAAVLQQLKASYRVLERMGQYVPVGQHAVLLFSDGGKQVARSPSLLLGTRNSSTLAGAKRQKEASPLADSFSSPSSSGKSAESADRQLAAQELLILVPAHCRLQMCHDGALSEVGSSPVIDTVWKGLSPEVETAWLVKAIVNMAVAGTLRNCARALRRLDKWVSDSYTALHGFSIPVSVLMHFLSVSVIGLVDETHVPRNLTDGLIFGAGHLSLGIPIKHVVVVAFCKVNHKLARSAVSTSTSMFLLYFHFATTVRGGKWVYSFPVRYVATCCMIWCISAVRCIDCQRAKMLGEGPSGTTAAWMAAACWDSKKKRAFCWLFPLKIFGETSWMAGLRQGWAMNDFMFCNFDAPRGTALGDMTDEHGPLQSPATPYMVQKWIRELYVLDRVEDSASGVPCGPLMEVAEAASTTRYGHRHWASNVVRSSDVKAWPMTVRKKVSNWGSISEMPDRYSQETEDLENFAIRVALLDVIWLALQRTPVFQWPVFGGWHLHSNGIATSSRALTAAHEQTGFPAPAPQDGSDADQAIEVVGFGDDIAGSDEGSDESDDEETAEAVVPRRGDVTSIPAGWKRESRTPPSGNIYVAYYECVAGSHLGKRLRSVREIERFLALP
jgi:hypothetical protein